MDHSNAKLTHLRGLLEKHNITAYLIPHNDAHDSEYIADVDERLAFISGFTGSAGIGLVTREKAFLWTDSRYFLQAQAQLEAGWEMKKMIRGGQMWFDYVREAQLKRVGFDPRLLNANTYTLRKDTLQKAESELVPVEENLVDEVWGTTKPRETIRAVFIHEEKWTGSSIQSKFSQLVEKLRENQADSALIANLAQIAWLLNLRGQDISYNPLFFSYLHLRLQDNTLHGTLYVNQEKLSPEVKKYLEQNNVSVKNYEDVWTDAPSFGGNKLLLNKGEINYRLFRMLPEDKLVTVTLHPVELAKAIKNEREVQGFRESHIRDGAALVRYLSWLERQLLSGNNNIDEVDGADQLEKFRRQATNNQGLSFDTISSSGSNAAVIHYKPESGKCKKIVREEIYLVDSGGQYLDGTTDVTRTFHWGNPTQQERDAYTRVLLGNLDIERLRFPANSNITGEDIDVLARRWLWENNLDYGHGTGHGVGYFLNVHEGPCGISKNVKQAFLPGMVVSNEPGYYKDGQFGIRIENLIVVVDRGDNYWGFENLTQCPYDRNLIDANLLSPRDRAHINAYHHNLVELLRPELERVGDADALAWLQDRAQPI